MRVACGDAVCNSAAIVDRSGVRAVYRKAHLWNTLHGRVAGVRRGRREPLALRRPELYGPLAGG